MKIIPYRMKSIDEQINELSGSEKVLLSELWVFQDDPRFPYLKNYHDRKTR